MPLNCATNSLTVYFCRVARPLLLIAGDQRPGIALDLLQRVPVR